MIQLKINFAAAFLSCLMLPQFAEAQSSTAGDLFLGLGYVQDSLQSIRDGTTVKAGGSPIVELFGTMAESGSFGFGIDISGRGFTAEVTEASATKFTYSLIDVLLNAQLKVFDSESFNSRLTVGAGGAWPVGRTCGIQTCPFDDTIPPVSPTIKAAAQFEFDQSYGLRVFGSHIPNAVWPSVIGPVTTFGATLFWNLTFEM
ncbi:MAG: hypothetical protein J0L82_03665 [Deltaproteobacteria bacterium]|jgi:hypothetical protein|nr:hypothetical protein [Deltaproteobacteria bacterium]